MASGIPEVPHQPKGFNFPKRQFGSKVHKLITTVFSALVNTATLFYVATLQTIVSRSFEPQWFERWS